MTALVIHEINVHSSFTELLKPTRLGISDISSSDSDKGKYLRVLKSQE